MTATTAPFVGGGSAADEDSLAAAGAAAAAAANAVSDRGNGTVKEVVDLLQDNNKEGSLRDRQFFYQETFKHCHPTKNRNAP